MHAYYFRPIAALLLGVGLLSGCQTGPLDVEHQSETIVFGRAVRYEPSPCWFEKPPGREVSCGQLVVPEDWTTSDAREIHLPIVAFGAVRGSGGQEPIVFLNGGPGSRSRIETAEEISGWIGFLSYQEWTHDRTFIVLAQRGTNWSDSNLECPPLSYPEIYAVEAGWPGNPAGWRQNIDRATKSCWQRLVAEGHDPAAYNSSQSAMDVAALRIALRIPAWSVFGASYGTRIALTLMRDYPDGITSVILESVYPPVRTDPDGDPAALHEALLHLFTSCASDALCSSNFPDLQNSFTAVIERLRLEPIEISFRKPDETEPLLAYLDPAVFLQIVVGVLSEREDLERIPDMIHEIKDPASTSTISFNDLSDQDNADTAHGAYLAIMCNDHPNAKNSSHTSGIAARLPLLKEWIDAEFTAQLCREWPSDGVPPSNHSAVRSDIPALILAGAFDPLTPVIYAELAAKMLTRPHVFVFPAASHGVIGSDPCASKIVAAFLAARDIRPDVGCPDPAQRPDFSPSLNTRALRLLRDGDHAAAEQLLREVQKAQADTLEPDHPNVAMTANNLALVHLVKGRHEEAELLLEKAAAIHFKATGPGSVQTAISSLLLALSYHVQGRDSEAETLFRRARRIERDLPAKRRAELAIALGDYVDLLRNLRQFDAAGELQARMAPLKRRQKT
jgi:pimeloyl-ACP methyl ester carboxylesterase